MTPETLVKILEAALLAAGRALTLDDFLSLFVGSAEAPDRGQLRTALAQLGESLDDRGIELVEVASGYRLQVRKEYSSWLAGLFSERPPRYSRALLETLALIAYRQPITRGEIEDVRGVVVSSNIIKTLMEREWIRVLGHREVPGRPALYGTTREFLDHFGLKGLEGLPPLADIRDLDQVEPDLFAPTPIDAGEQGEGNNDSPGGNGSDEDGGDDSQGEAVVIDDAAQQLAQDGDGQRDDEGASHSDIDHESEREHEPADEVGESIDGEDTVVNEVVEETAGEDTVVNEVAEAVDDTLQAAASTSIELGGGVDAGSFDRPDDGPRDNQNDGPNDNPKDGPGDGGPGDFDGPGPGGGAEHGGRGQVFTDRFSARKN